MGDNLLIEVFHIKGHEIDTLGLTNIGKTPTEAANSQAQASDVAGTSQTLTPPPTSRLFTSRLASIGYALVPQIFLNKMLKRSSTVEKKVKNIETRVEPCVPQGLGVR